MCSRFRLLELARPAVYEGRVALVGTKDRTVLACAAAVPLLLPGCQWPEDRGGLGVPATAPPVVPARELSPEESEHLKGFPGDYPPGDWGQPSVPIGGHDRPVDPAG